MTTAVVLVAAGLGRRLGDDGPKALVEVAGRSLLDHALERVGRAGPDDIVVVAAAGEVARFEVVADRHGVATVVVGADTRGGSVRAGVAAVAPQHDIVAIHDAARAFTPPAVIRAAIAAVLHGAIAAAPALPVPDTLKLAEDGEVVATVPRRGVQAVQTPQVFQRDVLDVAISIAAEETTDDLALVERAREEGLVSGSIRLVSGSRWATKITYPEDLALATLLARQVTP